MSADAPLRPKVRWRSAATAWMPAGNDVSGYSSSSDQTTERKRRSWRCEPLSGEAASTTRGWRFKLRRTSPRSTPTVTALRGQDLRDDATFGRGHGEPTQAVSDEPTGIGCEEIVAEGVERHVDRGRPAQQRRQHELGDESLRFGRVLARPIEVGDAPDRARTPHEAAQVATRPSSSSFAWPYGEAGRGGVASVKGGPTAAAYTPPADDARKNEPSSGRSLTRARAARKSSSSSLSRSSAGCSVAVTPSPRTTRCSTVRRQRSRRTCREPP